MLQMIKMWHKEVKKLAQHHPASEWQGKNLNLGILPSKSSLITPILYCFLTDDLKIQLKRQLVSWKINPRSFIIVK